MLVLALTVILGLIFAYFSTLNTMFITVNLFGTMLNIPLYVLALGSLLLGILISGIISFFNGISTAWAIRKRENKIRKSEENMMELKKKVEELEIENARLRDEGNKDFRKDEEIVIEHPKPRKRTVADLIRQNFSI